MTDSLILPQLKAARDSILVQISTGDVTVVEYEIDGRRVKRDAMQAWAWVTKAIRMQESQMNPGPHRNIANFVNP